MSKKKKAEEIEEEEVAPFWMISFSDMMSLLMSFFVLLFSMSTVEKEKMLAVMEGMGGRYLINGPHRGDKAAPIKIPKVPKSEKVTPPAPPPEPMTRPKPEKKETVSGLIVPFTAGSDQLDESGKQALNRLAEQLKGTPYPIMIKGHASKKEVDAHPAYQRVDDLAFARVFNVREYLVSLGLKAELFQLVELGQFKPLHERQFRQLSVIGDITDPNAYVEVIQARSME
ncbi:hypothetical protein FACS189419_07150 [Planctomycetales bacterium]|nr:hypothetical protein FACS189419_07150 [Planctomycetales bacterium]